MNERIRELADEAKEYAINRLDETGELHKYYDVYFEKFAELIVRECARVARATPAPNFHEHLKQQLGHTWDMAASEAGREIVKHFGVEE